MHITFVKKIKANGEARRKCADVEQRLRDSGYWNCIDTVLVADQRIADSAGVRLADALGVEDDAGIISVHTVYLKFVDDVLQHLHRELNSYETACA
jgi:hypothetical protein